MSGVRPFRDVKLQWLQQLSCDKDLSDNARSVALYIVTTHLNGHTETAWPSYQTIADATGKSVKTIQRAVRELEVKGWFEVQRGNGVVNERDEIREAFKTYFEGAEIGEDVDPALMYEIKSELDADGIYMISDIERFSAVYFKPRQRQSANDHQLMNAALDSPVSRFEGLQQEKPDEAEL